VRSAKSIKEKETVAVGFDLTVTHRNQYGEIVKQDPYTLIVSAGSDGGKVKLWERPKGSGNVWNRKGEPIGRYLRDERTGRGKFHAGAPHVEVVAPASPEEMYEKLTKDQAARIKALESELRAMQAENKKTQKPDKGA